MVFDTPCKRRYLMQIAAPGPGGLLVSLFSAPGKARKPFPMRLTVTPKVNHLLAAQIYDAAGNPGLRRPPQKLRILACPGLAANRRRIANRE